MTTIQVRRGTSAQWTAANTALAQGEIGFEVDTGKLKIGDGSTVWNSLGYITKDSVAATFTNKTISGSSNTLTNIAQSSVTNLSTDLAAKESTANKNAANGYLGADSAGKLPVTSISATGSASGTTYLRGDGAWATVTGETLNPFLLMGA